MNAKWRWIKSVFWGLWISTLRKRDSMQSPSLCAKEWAWSTTVGTWMLAPQWCCYPIILAHLLWGGCLTKRSKSWSLCLDSSNIARPGSLTCSPGNLVVSRDHHCAGFLLAESSWMLTVSTRTVGSMLSSPFVVGLSVVQKGRMEPLHRFFQGLLHFFFQSQLHLMQMSRLETEFDPAQRKHRPRKASPD